MRKSTVLYGFLKNEENRERYQRRWSDRYFQSFVKCALITNKKKTLLLEVWYMSPICNSCYFFLKKGTTLQEIIFPFFLADD